MENVKVFRMNDYEWWATKLDKEETNEFYLKETGLDEEDNPLEEIEECNLDKEGMWWETEDPADIEELGDADEIIGIEKVGNQTRSKVQLGNLMRRGNEVYKFISLREALKKHGDFEEPFCLASTEW